MTRRPLTLLEADRTLIAPSILAADFSRLGDEIRRVEEAGADVIHVDIMDAHFVPNLSIGPPVVAGIRPVTELPLDVHLMVTNPERYAASFAAAGADNITIHVEIGGDIRETLGAIRAAGCSAGITLRPGTPAAALAPYMADVDLVLVMTVEPGFGGQAFRADMLDKIAAIREMIAAQPQAIHLEVDGGIDAGTAPLVVAAGANLLVAGTSVFRAAAGARAAIAALRSPATQP